MFKDKAKGFIAGTVLTALVVSAIPTMAKKITESAQLVFNDIKVVVDGKRADLKDANGNSVEPFIIGGTTYLPVRAVANAFDKAVSWDGKTQTVYLGQNEEIEQPSIWLNDMETFTGDVYKKSVEEVEFGGREYNSRFTANNGDVYKKYTQISSYGSSNTFTTYLLGFKYSQLRGTIYLTAESKDSGQYHYRYLIYGDDTLLYTSDDVTTGSMPCDFAVDVSNINVLKIVHQYKTHAEGEYKNSSTQGAYIGNAGLYE